MKKILIGLVLILSLGLVGCSQSSNGDINVMSVNKAEKVVKSEYASRMKRANEIFSFDKFEEYHTKYSESNITEEIKYGANRDMYKEYVEVISTFRTEDEEVNKLHDKLIEISLDLYSMLDESIELGAEWNNILNSNQDRDITDKEEDRLNEIEEKNSILSDMIKNQEEHIDNILTELSNL